MSEVERKALELLAEVLDTPIEIIERNVESGAMLRFDAVVNVVVRALTPTDERVEAVARALFDFDYAISNTELDYEHEWILSRRNYVKLARVAIAAMGVTITPEKDDE